MTGMELQFLHFAFGAHVTTLVATVLAESALATRKPNIFYDDFRSSA